MAKKTKERSARIPVMDKRSQNQPQPAEVYESYGIKNSTVDLLSQIAPKKKLTKDVELYNPKTGKSTMIHKPGKYD